jgi:hypothetical protein
MPAEDPRAQRHFRQAQRSRERGPLHASLEYVVHKLGAHLQFPKILARPEQPRYSVAYHHESGPTLNASSLHFFDAVWLVWRYGNSISMLKAAIVFADRRLILPDSCRTITS